MAIASLVLSMRGICAVPEFDRTFGGSLIKYQKTLRMVRKHAWPSGLRRRTQENCFLKLLLSFCGAHAINESLPRFDS